MKLVKIAFRHTVHHRVATCGGTDSEFSHSTIEDEVMRIVVADDLPSTIAMAEAYCDRYGAFDRGYERRSTTVEGDIHAILRPALTRL